MLIVDILGDSDDAHRRRIHADKLGHRVRQNDVPIERLLVGEHSPRHALAYDHHRLAVLPVEIVEVSPGDHGHAERREKPGRHDAELAARIVVLRRSNVTFGRELEAGAEVTCLPPRRQHAQRNAVDPGQLMYAPHGLFVEVHHLPVRPPIRSHRHVDREHAARVDAGLYCLKRKQRLQQHRGARQQEKRGGDLGNRKRP